MNPNLLRFNKDKTLIAIDCETSNLCLSRHINLPWQVALLKVKNSQVIDSINIFIDHGEDYTVGVGAAKVTGYTREWTRGQKKPEKAVEYIIDFLNGNKFDSEHLDTYSGKKILSHHKKTSKVDYIFGHNFLNFDFYVLKSAMENVCFNHSFLYNIPILDTYALAKGLAMNRPIKPDEDLMRYQYKILNTKVRLPKLTLSALAKQYGVEIDESRMHESGEDLRVNFEILKQLLFKVEI